MRSINVNLTKPGYRCLDCGHEGERKSWTSDAPDRCPACGPRVGLKGKYVVLRLQWGDYRCYQCDAVSTFDGTTAPLECAACGKPARYCITQHGARIQRGAPL